MFWAQYVEMKYAQKLEKISSKGQKDPHKIFYRTLPANFTVLQYRGFATISSNLIKIAILKDILALRAL